MFPSNTFCLVLGVLCINTAHAQKAHFADNLSKCVANSPLDTCMRNTLEELRLLMPQGIPELGIMRTEPLEIANLQFRSRPNGLLNVESTFSQVVVSGLSKFRTNSIRTDLSSNTLYLSMTVPRLEITGKYEVFGKIFLFTVSGNGDFFTELQGVNGNGHANIVPVLRDGKQRLSIRNTDLDFQISRAKVRMDNLFNGELPDLAKEVNNWISDNSNLIIDEVKPQIRERMISMVEKVLNDSLSKVPADDLLKVLDDQQARNGRSHFRRFRN